MRERKLENKQQKKKSHETDSEEFTATEYRVGIFFILGLLLLAASVFLIAGEHSILARHYHLVTEVSDLRGLQNGSEVMLSGYKIGNVARIEFSPEENKLSVRLRILRRFQERIREGSTVHIRTNGVFGEKYVAIEPADLDRAVLAEGAKLVAEASGSVLETLVQRGGELEKVFNVVNQLEVLLKTINKNGRSEQLMSNLVTFSQEARQLIKEIRTSVPSPKSLENSVKSLESLLAKIDQGDGTLGALVNDPTLFNRAKLILGESPQTGHFRTLMREVLQRDK